MTIDGLHLALFGIAILELFGLCALGFYAILLRNSRPRVRQSTTTAEAVQAAQAFAANSPGDGRPWPTEDELLFHSSPFTPDHEAEER